MFFFLSLSSKTLYLYATWRDRESVAVTSIPRSFWGLAAAIAWSSSRLLHSYFIEKIQPFYGGKQNKKKKQKTKNTTAAHSSAKWREKNNNQIESTWTQNISSRNPILTVSVHGTYNVALKRKKKNTHRVERERINFPFERLSQVTEIYISCMVRRGKKSFGDLMFEYGHLSDEKKRKK